ncbi:MAG: ATPase, T2SS/T4P/T4SS family, partial [Planctomycetota bacterium]
MSAIDRTSTDAVARVRTPFDGGGFVRGLASSGLLGDADARVAEEVAKRNGTTPVRAVLDLGLMSEDALADALASALGARRFEGESVPGELSDALPAEFMRASGVLLFGSGGDGDASLVAVVSDPSDGPSRRAVVQRAGDRLSSVLVATGKEVSAFLDEREESLPAEELGVGDDVDVSGELSALRELASEAPVVRFFNQAVDRAMDLGASDIHIERYDRRTGMRFRVDGVLVEQGAPPSGMYDALLCRVKIMAGLDIAERRRAQDGRVQMKFRGRAVDMRVSLVPTMYGQDAAIRIQDRQRLGAIELKDLGFEGAHLRMLREASSKSHGIVLITGPTGSGKTTTLYALLREMASSARKIVTVEDPVEYAMDGINQIQVNNHVGLGF